MQKHVDSGSALSPHFEALMSRSLYVDLGMKTRRDCIIRIKQVIESDALNEHHHINSKSAGEILEFVEHNSERLRELSLRLIVKIGALKRNNPNDWKMLAKVTCCK